MFIKGRQSVVYALDIFCGGGNAKDARDIGRMRGLDSVARPRVSKSTFVTRGCVISRMS